MRFGQLSVQEMIPDITPLLKARQMKDQAFQNIAGTVMQFAADKEKKELDKKQKKQGIAAITPFLEDLARRNPALKDIDPGKFYALHGKDSLQEVARYMQASAVQSTAKANVLEQLNEGNEQAVSRNTDAVIQRLEQRFGVKGLDVDINNIRNNVAEIANEFGITNYNSSLAVNKTYENITKAGTIASGVEDKQMAIRKGLANTVSQFITQESIIDTAKDVYVDLMAITPDELEKEKNLILQSVSEGDKVNLKSAVASLTGNSDAIIAESYAFIQSFFKGTGASAFQQKLSALAGRIANTVLQGTRESSVDGSSGYGQLTGPELTLLKNFYGALVTEGGSLSNFSVIQETLERIMREIPQAASRRFENASQEFGTKNSLGYNPTKAKNEMLEDLRKSPNFALFDLGTGEAFDITSFIEKHSTGEKENNNASTTGNNSTLSSLFRTEPTVSSFSKRGYGLLSDPPRGDAIYRPYPSSSTGTSSMIPPVPQYAPDSVDLGRGLSVVDSGDGLEFFWGSKK